MTVTSTVAVVVCAYTEKRWDDVLSAYHSLIAQTVPADEIVLVIDHNPALSARLAAALPDATVVGNAHAQGLSGARNTGISVTTADLVLFLDDDAAADPQWIEQLTAAFVDPAVVGTGGWAVPRWDSPGRPSWFPDSFLWVVGSSYEGQSRTSGPIRNPLGCAMAFRRSALDSTAGFSDGVGRVGTHPLGCEETELSIRIARANPGTTLVGAPQAVVSHRVTAPRMTVRYFLSRCYWEGVSKAVVAAHVGAGAALASERTYTTKVLPRAFFRGLGDGLRGRWSGPLQSLAIATGLVVTTSGYLRGRRTAVTPVTATAPVVGERSAGATSSNGRAATMTTPQTMRSVAPVPPVTEAIWCTECELTGPWQRLTPPAAGAYAKARILVRQAGLPLEFVELAPTGTDFDRTQIVAALSDRSRGRLSDGPDHGSARETGTPAEEIVADTSPLVSVVVCTRDRGPELRDCLRRLQRLDYPNLEIIIVDNAPSDTSGNDAFRAQVGSDPRFRYVVEPAPGLSCARNRGLAEATGEYLAYTDDDVAVDPHWITALVAGFGRREDIACVTGLVCTAALETAAEHYFDQRVSWADSCEPRIFDLSSRAEDPLYPYAAGLFGTGASMAFSTALLRELGGFDEALGAGTRAKGGEDLDIFVRILLEGRAIAYEPGAIVWHHHRSDLAGLRRQIFGYGTGLSAFITKHLLDPDTRPDLLRRIPPGIAKAVIVPLGRPARTGRDAGTRTSSGVGSRSSLIAREFAGMAMGPALYAMARRSSRSAADEPKRSAA